MRKFYAFITVIVVLSILVTACGSRRPGPVVVVLGPSIASIAVPSGLNAGESFTFSATTTGTDVVAWSWNFGGGADPNTSTLESPMVTLVNPSTDDPATYTVTLIVTDADGRTDTFTADYTVERTLNTPPGFVGDIVFATADNTATVTFTITDADEDDVTITLVLTAPGSVGMSADVINATFGDYGPFVVTLTNGSFDEAAVTVDITLDDGTDTTPGSAGGTIAGITPEMSNSIIVVPSATAVSVGDTFTVTVYVYDLTSPAGWFNSTHIPYGDGISPVYDPDPADPTTSWNLGAVGGGTWGKDGAYWTTFPDPILAAGEMLFLSIEPGAVVVNCSAQTATPTGSDIGAGGPLFNFQMTADTPGSWELTFTSASTYYTAPDGTQQFYDDEVSATITVS